MQTFQTSKEISLLTLAIITVDDLVNVRQRVRQVMELLNFKKIEQTRMATAVSEIARNAYQYAKGGKIHYRILLEPDPKLIIHVVDNGAGITNLDAILQGSSRIKTDQPLGILGAQRLVDKFNVKTSPAGTNVELLMDIPQNIQISPIFLGKLVEELVKNRPRNFSEELLQQNQELLQTFSLLNDARNDLERRVSERTVELTKANQLLTLEIEKRKTTENNLRDARDRLTLSMEAAKVGTWTWLIDKNKLIWDQYACSLFGITLNEFDNTYDMFLNFLPVEDKVRVNKQLFLFMEQKKDLALEFRIIHRDGTLRYLMMRGKTYYSQNETATTMIGVIWDVTEHIKMKEKIRTDRELIIEIERITSLKEVASSLAHEINQPLATINAYTRGCINRMNNEMLDRTEVLNILQKVSYQAQRAGEVVHRIKSFVQKGKLFYEKIEMSEVIVEAIQIMQYEIEKYAVEIVYILSDKNKSLYLDKIQIQQVILNISRNAMEAMHGDQIRQPKVTLESGLKDPTTMYVRITDNGLGFKEKETSKLFEAYFSTKPRGMGLGLKICRSIVEAHGGELTAKNLTNGGCAFEFSLPISNVNPNES